MGYMKKRIEPDADEHNIKVLSLSLLIKVTSESNCKLLKAGTISNDRPSGLRHP
jgi:hypothetical protein